MAKRNNFEDIVESDVNIKIQEYKQQFKDRTSNPKNFLTISELEKMFHDLESSTKDSYVKLTTAMLDNVNESDIIAEKKTTTSSEASDSSPTEEHQEQ